LARPPRRRRRRRRGQQAALDRPPASCSLPTRARPRCHSHARTPAPRSSAQQEAACPEGARATRGKTPRARGDRPVSLAPSCLLSARGVPACITARARLAHQLTRNILAPSTDRSLPQQRPPGRRTQGQREGAAKGRVVVSLSSGRRCGSFLGEVGRRSCGAVVGCGEARVLCGGAKCVCERVERGRQGRGQKESERGRDLDEPGRRCAARSPPGGARAQPPWPLFAALPSCGPSIMPRPSNASIDGDTRTAETHPLSLSESKHTQTHTHTRTRARARARASDPGCSEGFHQSVRRRRACRPPRPTARNRQGRHLPVLAASREMRAGARSDC
jgi:hypothetical protein